MFGALSIAIGFVMAFPADGGGSLGSALFASPMLSGLAVCTGGFAVGLYGATRLLAPRSTFRETKLNRFEQLFGGVLFTTMSVLILTVGVFLIVAPEALAALRDKFFEFVTAHLAR
jgi:hypothetical protein